MRHYAIKVDLQAPGVDVLVTPGNGARRRDHDAQTTSMFARQQGCQVAINGSPFFPVLQIHAGPKDIRGVSKSRGHLDSPPDPDYAAIGFGGAQGAAILDRPIAVNDLAGFEHVLGGFDVVLRGGRDVSGEARHVRGVHPRVALGLSEDARELFILVVDGRQRQFSRGASLSELATMLRDLGATDGINLDGGGSLALVAEVQGSWAPLNRPNHMLLRGVERVVPNHLCIYAPPLTGG